MAESIVVVPVKSKRELREFIKFPWRVYKNDPNWVPPLIFERKAFFDPKKNPFYEHAEVELFLAKRGSEVIGTVAGIINYRHNEFHAENTGFFGFFEVIEDYGAAEVLLATARDWVQARGMDTLRGPANFSTNEEVGLLVEGFEMPPVIFMTYNPEYYVDFIERFGFRKAMDLYAYEIKRETYDYTYDGIPEKLVRVAELVPKRYGIKLRKVNMKDMDGEIAKVKKLYNRIWEKNWGFVPMTDAEFDHMARGLKQIADPNIVFFAEKDGEPIGFSLSLPDVCETLRRMNGRMFPFGWLVWLLGKKRIKTLRVVAMGVLEEYRGKGFDSLFYLKTIEEGDRKGYDRCETGWVLETNDVMNRTMEMLGGERYKTYRLYDLRLAEINPQE
ncbi:MAG: N-acetyltransferase [Candidatus Coatesbacteria bacterium]|nr:MAG: N-acetyltransferase [Candidatus Coatesbacteria bacterium]